MRSKVQLLTVFVAGTMLVLSCKKETKIDIPDAVQIYYLELSNNQIMFGDSTSFANLKFQLKDGDGDIALSESERIYVTDMRSDTVFAKYEYLLPVIPLSQRKYKYIDGTVLVNFKNRVFIPRLDTVHLAAQKDTLRFQVYVKDSAGNKSNIIETDEIYISF